MASIFIVIPFYTVIFITLTYFFGQNITVTNNGLLVEFLWKDFFVSWDNIVEIKPAYGFCGNYQNTKIYIVLTDALTPFHRFFGMIYGFSIKPAFIIYSTITEYKLLVETIKEHAPRR